MKYLLVITIFIFVITTLCGNHEYIPPPAPFAEADLIGTWSATYGSPTTTDTIILHADGTYQQVFQSPELDYYYESSWNKWQLEYSSSGKPKVHFEGMRYYDSLREIGERGGRYADGEPVAFFDIDEAEDEGFKMLDKVILRVNGDDHAPRGIILRHMHTDLDSSPAYYVLVKD